MDELSRRNFMDRRPRVMYSVILCLFGMLTSHLAVAQELKLAVSSSIKAPITSICHRFAQSTKHKCKITTASTGHLYAQIMHASPYDILLSADDTYTQGLINALKADPDNRLVLATGRIVLWSNDPEVQGTNLQEVLNNADDASIAIANPGVTPYGIAAKEVLQYYHLWARVQGRIIWGKNLQQTYDLISKKRVPLGFVSLSQLTLTKQAANYWEPEIHSYKPVHHEAIGLLPNRHPMASVAFMEFLKSPECCKILLEAGYNCWSKPDQEIT